MLFLPLKIEKILKNLFLHSNKFYCYFIIKHIIFVSKSKNAFKF